MFITLEGGEGAGKTTQILHLAEWFQRRGTACLLTREPGGTPLGKSIRALLLDPENRSMAPETELMLYMADRAEHVQRVILPAVSAGRTVLCDRFFDATLVYQGFARGLPLDRLLQLHQLVLNGLRPQLTLLLDLPAEVGLARARGQLARGARAQAESRFEREEIDFHRRVREGYLSLARQEPGRFRIIDAGRDEERVEAAIRAAVAAFIHRPDASAP
ncbi:MAG: dTMP kinase [Desulfobacterales bacterium]|jgi:dTMP kinase|nr:dTMP kinase [Desulfobacterales bacterium]